MRTDTSPSRSRQHARNYLFAAIAWSLGVFGLLRVGWVEAHLLLPFTQLQGRIAQAAMGAPALPIDVTLACSGADAMALCAGAILAYPSTWRQRMSGAATGLALILVLNTIRIGTLGRAAASPFLFETLHIYIWPALLILAIAGYVFGWMSLVNAGGRTTGAAVPRRATSPPLTRRFAAWAAICVVVFVAASPLYLQSATVLAVASLIARVSARALGLLGMEATATANVLWTSKGGFEVSQECLSTPLVPLYFAAVITAGAGWRWRLIAVAAAAPLFIALGILRLLVVALPAAIVGSELFLVHAFYQLLLAALLVYGATAWQRGHAAWTHAVMGCVLGVLVAYGAGPIYTAIMAALTVEIPFNDPQGAMASLPSFQTGLYVALTVATMSGIAWRWFGAGFAVLAALQLAAFGALYALSRYTDLAPHIRDVRAWAIAAPVIVILGVLSNDRPHR